jgi:integrase
MVNITATHRDAFVVKRQAAGASNAEINREISILKRAFTLAVEAGTLLHAPSLKLLNENNVRRGFFSDEEIASVIGHLPAALQPIIRFAYITGWRVPSEVLKLEWRCVDFVGHEVTLEVGTTKNDEARTFPFTDELRELLAAQWEVHQALPGRGLGCPRVFHRSGRPVKSFRKAWSSATRAAGLPGRIPHDLRRSAIRNMVRRGVPERVAMMLSGHKTRSVFDRYNIVSSGDLRSAAKTLSDAGVKTGSERVG